MVVLRVELSETGHVAVAKVQSSSGYVRLDGSRARRGAHWRSHRPPATDRRCAPSLRNPSTSSCNDGGHGHCARELPRRAAISCAGQSRVWLQPASWRLATIRQSGKSAPPARSRRARSSRQPAVKGRCWRCRAGRAP
ncbi:MAG: hypothetical protein IPI44_21845 [Sulfuritalea sp.]|nr:hypothetical protein [Sulfuritalea sp.]